MTKQKLSGCLVGTGQCNTFGAEMYVYHECVTYSVHDLPAYTQSHMHPVRHGLDGLSLYGVCVQHPNGPLHSHH